MNKVYKFIYLITFMAFLVTAFSFFLERNDFLGEMIDAKIVKTQVKADAQFENSVFKNDSKARSKFRRMELSSLIADPQYKNELMKFDAIKSRADKLNNALSGSEIILGLFSIAAFAAALFVIVYKRAIAAVILNAVLIGITFYYNIVLSSAVSGVGLEKKVYENWGVAQSVQHLVLYANLIVIVGALVYGFLKFRKEGIKEEKDSIKNNFNSTTKYLKMIFSEAGKNKFAYYMLGPAIVVVIVIIIYPFLYNFRISFSNLNLKRFVSFIAGDKLYFSGLGNYVEILFDPSFWKVFARTIVWTSTNVCFHVVGGVFLAILLNRNMRFKGIYQTIIILPWAVPQFIAVLVWKGMFNSDYGAINLILSKTISWMDPASFQNMLNSAPWLNAIAKIGENGPMVAIPWLTDPVWAFTGAIITNIWLGIPFMMMIALGGLQSIPETYYEAADIDGASAWQKIWNITIPQLKPVMMPAIIMGVVWTFNNLNVIYLLTTDSLTGKVDILVTYVYKAAFNLYRYGYAAAFSGIIFAILMAFSIVMIKSSKTEEGVK